jgi:DNA-binding NarL/FixJ family response regulator
MDAVKVLLADDHANVRAQLKARLAREAYLHIVGEATNSSQTIECVQAHEPDVLLIDPVMRDGLGLEAVRRIAERDAPPIIVVLTAAADTALVLELRDAGVRHILNKNLDSRQLVETLSQVKLEIERRTA